MWLAPRRGSVTNHDFFSIQTSKTLNYLDSSITGPYFFLFMCVWIYMRHYLNLRILWSLLTEFRTVGPYEINWETEQYKCLLSNVITFTLLALLQALNLFWLFFIIRIAYRFVVDKTATDDRSNDEDSAEENEDTGANDKDEKKPLTQVAVEAVQSLNTSQSHAKLRLRG
jgi:acyl-CoA-dependent ceramide synthase